jgi:hypothetical protein
MDSFKSHTKIYELYPYTTENYMSFRSRKLIDKTIL